MSAIYLTIAGFNIKINFQKINWVWLRDKLQKEIEKHYQGFINNDFKKSFDYQINFIQREFLKILFKQGEGYFVNFCRLLNKNTIETYYQISLIQLELIINKILQELLSKNKGFVFHASANLINNRASLFLAPSGGGKSTIMTLLSKKFLPLAGDTVIIKKEKKQYYIYQTPFSEKDHWLKKNKERYPLGKIFFIKKAPYFKVKPIINKKIALDLILKQFWTNEMELKKQITHVLSFVGGFKEFYYLYFAKDQQKLINFISKT